MVVGDMATVAFTSYDIPHGAESVGHGEEWSLWRWYNGIAVGRVIMITNGVATPSPGAATATADQYAAADAGSGQDGKAIWHTTDGAVTVTSAEATILIAAGYTLGLLRSTYVEGSATLLVPLGGQTSDVLIILAVHDGSDHFTTPTGWSDEGGDTLTGQGESMAYRIFSRAWADEPASYTLNQSATHGIMLLLRGVNSTPTIIDVDDFGGGAAATYSLDPTTLTTTVGDIMIGWFAAVSSVTSAVMADAETIGMFRVSPGPDPSDTDPGFLYVGYVDSGFSWEEPVGTVVTAQNQLLLGVRIRVDA